MSHRIAGMLPCAGGYRALCECGWTSKPAHRKEARDAFHEHAVPNPTLEELVAEVVAAWALMDHRWFQWSAQQDRNAQLVDDYAHGNLEPRVGLSSSSRSDSSRPAETIAA